MVDWKEDSEVCCHKPLSFLEKKGKIGSGVSRLEFLGVDIAKMGPRPPSFLTGVELYTSHLDYDEKAQRLQRSPQAVLSLRDSRTKEERGVAHRYWGAGTSERAWTSPFLGSRRRLCRQARDPDV